MPVKNKNHHQISRAPRLVAALLFTGLGALLIYLAYLLFCWMSSSSTYVIESPRPSPYAPVVPEVQLVATQSAKPADPLIDQVVDAVFTLESSRGKHDPCRRVGKFNGYGYAPGKCFDSPDSVRTIVFAWFDKKLNQQGFTLGQAACYYNLGKPDGKLLTDCEYHQKLIAQL